MAVGTIMEVNGFERISSQVGDRSRPPWEASLHPVLALTRPGEAFVETSLHSFGASNPMHGK